MASRKKKIIIVIASVLICGFAIEFLREWIWYMYKLRNFQSAYWQIQKQIGGGEPPTKKELITAIGPPDAIEKTDTEYWRWQSESHQGFFWRKLKLHRKEEFYSLEVQFDDGELASEVYSFGHEQK